MAVTRISQKNYPLTRASQRVAAAIQRCIFGVPDALGAAQQR